MQCVGRVICLCWDPPRWVFQIVVVVAVAVVVAVVVAGSTCVCRHVEWCDFLAGMC